MTVDKDHMELIARGLLIPSREMVHAMALKLYEVFKEEEMYPSDPIAFTHERYSNTLRDLSTK